MAEQKIELRKVRDFSEVLNDTFVFIKQNLKPLLTCFIAISGIFMLAAAIFNGFYQSQIGGIFEQIFRRRGPVEDYQNVSMFTSTYILVPLLAWLNVIAMKASIISYMKVYEVKGETPELSEVWQVFGRYFFKLFFFSIPIVIVIAIGCIFCVAPGLYLWVVLMPFEMILVVEDETFGGAWDRCFVIIKENFWASLGIYIVAYLIYLVCGGIVGGVMSLLSGILAYFTTKDISTTVGVVTSILNIFSFVFFIVWYIAAMLNYFSLAEKYDGIGMMRRLDDLGNTPTSNIEEQY